MFLSLAYVRNIRFLLFNTVKLVKSKNCLQKSRAKIKVCPEAKYTFSFGSLPVVCQQEVGDMDDVDAIVITEGQRIPHRLIHKRNNSVDVVWTQVHWCHLTCFSTLYQKSCKKERVFQLITKKQWKSQNLIYLTFLPAPTLRICPAFTILPKTASIVVALTSGRILPISALETGVRLLRTVASILACLVTFLLPITANRLSSSL